MQVAVSSDETAPPHLTAEEFKKPAVVNWWGIVNSSAVNCRGVLLSFICVFQPYNMCEHQFSSHFCITINILVCH